MSALGNETNIKAIIVEHTHRGMYNYNLGKDTVKKGNMGDYQVQYMAKGCLTQIGYAIEVLSEPKFKDVLAADIALNDLKGKAVKLQKKIDNAISNHESLPKLEKILKETDFDKIEKAEAEEILKTVEQTSVWNATSKTNKISLEILSKLSKFAPKEANNNSAPFTIEIPNVKEESEEGSEGDRLEDKGFGEELFEDFKVQQFHTPSKEEDNFGVNNNSFIFLPPVKPANPLEEINQALKLVLNAKEDAYHEALQEFLKTIKTTSGMLERNALPNFEHILHSLIYNTFLESEMETKDVDGKPFGQYALEVGLVLSDMLQDCCKKALTIVHLSVLDKLLSTDQDQAENAIADLMPELEAHDMDTANKIYGETWNHATKEERNQPNSDFGKEAFRSLNKVTVSLATKLKAVKTVLDIRKKEYGIK